MIKQLILFVLFFHFSNIYSQNIETLSTLPKTSFRGLSVVDDETLWVSGSNGVIGRSTTGGKTWKWMKIPGFEKRDFRDIEAFDSETALVIAVDEPAYILKTKDGGDTWKPVYYDTTKGMFLDAIDFINDSIGVVVGDPVDGKAFVIVSKNGGETWKDLEEEVGLPRAKLVEGEAFFASSGTNVKLLWNTPLQRFDFIYITGGKKSRIFVDGVATDIPILQGTETTGANGMDITPNYEGVIVGGDFSKDSLNKNNCVLFNFKGGLKFYKPTTPPNGYKSSVTYLNRKILICCGTTGVDFSKDGGKTWKLVSKESYHVIQKAKKGNAVYLAGNNGRISRFWAK